MSSKLFALIVVAFLLAGYAHAGVDAGALCREKKAKAAGKKAFDLMKAFGKNMKKPNADRLVADVSKVRSRFTKFFEKTEAKGGCLTSDDADAVESKVDGHVYEIIASVDPKCADPDDCRLWEAGRMAGVGVGLATALPGGDRRELLLAEANIAVNHAISWQAIWPERDRWSFEQADAIMAFHRENGLRSMAFHFAWEQAFLDDLPDWVLGVEDPQELRALLVERAEVIFERYPDLDRINVINEPLPTLGGSSGIYENYFFRVLGPDYIADLFEIVDAAAPADVKLVLNENFVEYFPAKAEGLVALVTDLVQRGVPIDSVGFQTHVMLTELLGREPDWDLYEETMRRVADLGLDVWISELDNPVDPARPDRFAYQAENYARAVEVCLSVPRCGDILIWGIQDEPAYWFPLPYDDPAPLLFDQDFKPKPAYFAVRDALLAGRPAPSSPSTAFLDATSGSRD